MLLTRRTAVLGAASTLAGCGFHPLYAPTSNGVSAGEELQAVYVDVMAERQGQLLRQALQRRFAGTDEGVAKKYELFGGLAISTEAIAIQRDTSSTYTRITGNASWGLRTMAVPPVPLTQGNSRVLDGINILDNQYFAADLETETVYRRIAETCADQITLQVATFLKRRAQAAT